MFQAKITATYVHDIWNKWASEDKIDININYLQLASIQLLNTKPRFSACDCYPLDWTLLEMVKLYFLIDAAFFITITAYINVCVNLPYNSYFFIYKDKLPYDLFSTKSFMFHVY